MASIAQFLIDGSQEDAVSVLLACSLIELKNGESWWDGGEQTYAMHVHLPGPRYAYEILRDETHPITNAVRDAIKALLPPNQWLKHLSIGLNGSILTQIGGTNCWKSLGAKAFTIKLRMWHADACGMDFDSGQKQRLASHENLIAQR